MEQEVRGFFLRIARVARGFYFEDRALRGDFCIARVARGDFLRAQRAIFTILDPGNTIF